MSPNSQQKSQDIAGRQPTREAFEKSKEHLQTLFGNLLEGVQILGHDWRYLYLNETAERHNRRSNQELLGQKYMDKWPGIEETQVFSVIEHCMKDRVACQLENKFVYSDGIESWFVLSIQPIPEGVFILSFDVTERVRAEKQVAQMKRLYATLSQVNQTIVRVKEVDELYRSICDVSAKFGEFSLAWVGLLEEASGDVKPVAANGLDVTQWPFPIVNTKRGPYQNEVISQALLTSSVVTSTDIQSDKRTQRLQGRIRNYNFHSLAVVPFRLAGETIGVLCLISPETGFFNSKEEISLLEEMGLDISFALDTIETQRIKRQWADAFEHCGHGLVIGDPGTNRIRTCNPAFAREHGGTIEEFTSMPLVEMYAPDDREQIKQYIAQSDRTGSVRFEANKVRKDGSVYAVQMDLVSVRDEHGNLLYRVATQENITERKQAEQALLESWERYKSLFENNPHPMWVYDLETLAFVMVNDAAVNHYGYGQEEFLGMTLKEIRPVEDIPALLTNVEQEHARLQHSSDWRHRKKDGSIIDVEISSHALQFEDRAARLVLANDITARKRAEAERTILAERLDLATRSAKIGIWDWDIRKNEIVWDDQMYALYGLKPGEFGGAYQAWLQGVHPEDRAPSNEISAQAVRGEREYDTEFRVLWPDSSVHWLKADGQVFRDEHGTPLRMVGVNYDITERRHAEAAVRDSQARLAGVIDSAMDAIISMDEGQRITLFNPAAEAMFGCSAAEAIGQPLEQFIPEQSRSRHREYVRAFGLSGRSSRSMAVLGPLTCLRASGEEFPAEITISQSEMAGQKIYTAILRDSTERVRAEREIKEIQSILSMAEEVAQIGSWKWDLRTQKVTWSDEMFRLFEVEREGFDGDVNRVVSERIHPDDMAAVQASNRSVIEQGSPIPLSYRIVLPDGTERTVWAQGKLVQDETGQPVALTGYVQDITERKRAEDAVHRYNQQLTTIVDIEHSLAKSLNQEVIYKTLVKGIQELFPDVPTIFISSFDDQREMIKAEYGSQDNEPVDIASLPEIPLAPAGRGTQSQVIRTRQPLIINSDLKNNLRQGTVVRIGSDDKETQSAVYVPMLAQDKVLGLIQLQSYASHRFTEDDSRVLSLIANTAAVSIQNAGLYERAQKEIAERKLVEENLVTSQRTLQLFVEHAPAAIAMFDRDMIYLAASHRYLNDYRLPDESVVGRSHYEVFPEIPERWKEIHRRCLAGAIEKNEEDPFLRMDGTLDWIRWEIHPWYEKSGEIGGILLFSEVITERLQTNNKLRESEKKYRDLINGMNDTIWVIDFDTTILDVNNAATAVLGYTRDELLSMKIGDIDVDLKPEQIQGLASTMPTDKVQVFETWHTAKDGRKLPVEVSSSLVSYMGQTVIMSIARDITERRRAEEALRENETRFRSLVENSSDEVSIISIDGKLLYESPTANPTLGYQPGEFFDRNIFQIMHPDDVERVKEQFARLIQDPEAHPRDQFRLLHQNGSWRWVEAVGTNLLSEPSVHGIVINYHDITERRQAEDALQLSEERHRQISSLISDYVYSGIIFPDSSGKTEWASGAFERITGYTLEEINQLPAGIFSLTLPEDLEIIMRQQPVMFEQGSISVEYRIRHKNGEIRWLRDYIHNLSGDGQSGPVKIIGAVQDITEQVRAEREIQQRNEDLLIINALNEAVNRGEEIDGIVEAFARETRSAFTCQDVAIYLLSPDAKYIEMQNSTLPRKATERIEKLIGRPIPKIQIPVREDGYFKRIMENEQGLITSDPKLIQQWIEEFTETTFLPSFARSAVRKMIPQIYRALNIGSAISIPLVSSGRTIGILDMSSRGQFSEADRKRISSISHQVTAVLMRKQAEAQVQLQLRRLSALSEIDRAISSSLDLRLSLDVVLNEVLSQLGVDAAAVFLLNESNLALEYCAGKGFHTMAIRQSRMRLGDGFAGQVGLERKLLHVSNLPEVGPSFARAELLKSEGFFEYFGVPLVAKGMLKGVLEIYHRTPLSPDPEWMNYLETLGGQTAIAIDNAQLFEGMQKSNLELIAAYDATIAGWSHAMDLRDKETEGHSQRVTELTLNLAERLGVSEQEQVHVRRGALLHDIGKLGVPDQILFKTGQLTEEEWTLMRQHPIYAFAMLSPISYLRPALDIPYCHHEKWDGSGYPRGLQGEQIPLPARIFAVVDVWDALCSDRPYRKAWPEEKVLRYIRAESGKHFDPHVVEVFLDFIRST